MALSQSERVNFTTSGLDTYFDTKIRVVNKVLGGPGFLNFWAYFNEILQNIKFSKYLPLGFAFHRLVLKLSASKGRRAHGHSRTGQERSEGQKTTGAYMASVNSVDGQTIWYILDDITQYLGYYRNILAVIGIFDVKVKCL